MAKYLEIKKVIDSHIYEVCELTCHEGSANDNVEKDKKYSIVEKADLSIKKDMEHKEIPKEEKDTGFLETTV